MKILSFLLPLFALMTQCTSSNDQSKTPLTAILAIAASDNELVINLTNTSTRPFVVDGKLQFFTDIKFYNLRGEKYVNTNTDISRPPGSPLLTIIDAKNIPASKERFKNRFVTLKPGCTLTKIIKSGEMIEDYIVAISDRHDHSITKYGYLCPDLANVGKIDIEYRTHYFNSAVLPILSRRNGYEVPLNYFKGKLSAEWIRPKGMKKLSN